MKRLKRISRLDAGMKGWITNTAKKNFWRAPRWYSLEDLIQDGYLCYTICHRKYPRTLTKQHFMSLVKSSYQNHITDLANIKTQMSFEILAPPDSDVWIRATPEEATFITLLRQAPVEVQELIKCLLSNAQSMERIKRDDRTWETLNEQLCRIAGVDASVVDMQKVFAEHFGVRSCN